MTGTEQRARVAALLRVLVLVAVGGFAVLCLVGLAVPAVRDAADWVYVAAWTLGGTEVLVSPTVHRRFASARKVLGAGMLTQAVTEAYVQLGQPLDDADAYPSLADAGYLLWYVAVLALLLLVVRGVAGRLPSRVWLDGLVTGLGAGSVTAALFVDDLVSVTGGSAAAVFTNLAYPLSDLLLVVVVAVGWGVAGPASRAMLPFVVAVLLFAAGDVAYLFLDTAGDYVSGGPVDLLWLVSLVAFVLGPRLARPHVRLTPQVDPDSGLVGGAGRLVLPGAAVAAALVVIAADQVHHVPVPALLLADAALAAAVGRVVATVRAVRRSESRELERATAQVRTDDLTGLANRLRLMERAEQLMATCTQDSPVSVLVLDLDRFKEVNDSLGHESGDQLVRAVAERLLDVAAPGDLVARLGGDEFAVLMPGAPVGFAVDRARTVVASLAAPFSVSGLRLHVAGSVGVATAPDPARTAGDLLRLADSAMYEAKRARGSVAVARDGGQSGPERLQTVDELVGALSGDDPDTYGVLVVHLQPQVALTGTPGHGPTTGLEALVRWEHPRHGLMAPGRFLPLAESAGLLGLLARVVLDRALGAARIWWEAGFEVPVSVNLAASDLEDEDLPDVLSHALAEHGLPAAALVVELTEDTLMADPRSASVLLHRIRDLGVGVSIDDYGTGYSSLAYLRVLPADELKLDRSFTKDLPGDAVTGSIVRTTVDLAHSLGLRLVAEGIEDAAAAAALAAFGCDVGQGFHFARPMPVGDVLQWLASRAVQLAGPIGSSVLADRPVRPAAG